MNIHIYVCVYVKINTCVYVYILWLSSRRTGSALASRLLRTRPLGALIRIRILLIVKISTIIRELLIGLNRIKTKYTRTC